MRVVVEGRGRGLGARTGGGRGLEEEEGEGPEGRRVVPGTDKPKNQKQT